MWPKGSPQLNEPLLSSGEHHYPTSSYPSPADLPRLRQPPVQVTSTKGAPALPKPIPDGSRKQNTVARAVATQARQRDKFVPLPNALTGPVVSDGGESTALESEEEWIAPSRRITVYCLAESFDRKLLQSLLTQHYSPGAVTPYSDVVHLALEEHGYAQDVFFFDFGVIITFGLDKAQEQSLMSRVGTRVQLKPYSQEEVEVDEFQFVYSATEPPHIKNDMFTINKQQAKNHQVRLAIAHALAQSTKLSVYEERVWDLVEETRGLPEALAQHGTVQLSTKRVAQLIGKVFLQNANVNLLVGVLDTPAFFWSAPDHLQALYERAVEYLELESRVEVLNARFQVLQEMLEIVRSHLHHNHAERLELIIIWLLVLDCILMLFQLLSLFGYIGRH